MLPVPATIAVATTTLIAWAMTMVLGIVGLCQVDPFGEFEGDLSNSIIEIKMDGPEVPSLQIAPPDDIEEFSARA